MKRSNYLIWFRRLVFSAPSSAVWRFQRPGLLEAFQTMVPIRFLAALASISTFQTTRAAPACRAAQGHAQHVRWWASAPRV